MRESPAGSHVRPGSAALSLIGRLRPRVPPASAIVGRVARRVGHDLLRAPDGGRWVARLRIGGPWRLRELVAVGTWARVRWGVIDRRSDWIVQGHG